VEFLFTLAGAIMVTLLKKGVSKMVEKIQLENVNVGGAIGVEGWTAFLQCYPVVLVEVYLALRQWRMGVQIPHSTTALKKPRKCTKKGLNCTNRD